MYCLCITPTRKHCLSGQKLLSEAHQSQNFARDLDVIDPARVALVDTPLELPPSTPGQASISVDRPGYIQIHTDTPALQLLVVSESYHAGWQPRVDGQIAPLVRPYGDFIGCTVPAGAHEVDFRFRPMSYRVGWWISAGGIVLALISFVVVRYGDRSAGSVCSD